MKKTILVFMISIIMICCYIDCSGYIDYSGLATIENAKHNNNSQETSMFVKIEQSVSWKIVYHKDTKVMYAVSCGPSNHGNFTLLVNPDGTPMLYEE